MAVWYCNFGDGATTGYYAVAAWTTGTKTAGTLRRQAATPAVGSERVFVCIVGGASLASEPTWVLTKGAITADSSASWIEVTGQPGVNGDTTNTPAAPRLTLVGLGLVVIVGTHLHVVTVSGTTASSAPTFPTTAGSTVVDGGATYTCLGLASSFGAWAAPFARTQSVFASGWGVGGDICYVGDNHAETQTATMTIVAPSTEVMGSFYCVSHTAAVPPTSANLATTATITTTGATPMNVAANLYFNGFTFSSGTGSVGGNLSLAVTTAGIMRFDNCVLGLGTAAGSNIIVGGSTQGTELFLNNTTLKFGNIAQGFRLQYVRLLWRNTPSAIPGSVPTQLFSPLSGSGPYSAVLEGIDLSALATSTILPYTKAAAGAPSRIYLLNCKTASGTIFADAIVSHAAGTLDAVVTDSSGTDYAFYSTRYQGALSQNATIIRTSGASTGSVGYSYRIATTANSSWLDPFDCFPISVWNTTTGANVTVTLHGIWSSSTLPNNNDLWVSVGYLGSSSSPLFSSVSETITNGLAASAPLTADTTSAWDSQVTARINNTAYNLGDTIKVASNPGRVFFCVTAGTSTSPEPAGYATAADGGTVTDGGAHFQAGVRFSLSVVLTSPTPQMVGYLRATVKAALASSTFYVDPLLVLT